MIATRSATQSARTRPSRLLAVKPDHDLIEAVREGDDSAFEELYRRYNDRIAAYVGRMVHDRARAEDLAQDAFLSALRRIRATDAAIAFKPWIFEIARNATIDHWRRTSRAEEVSVEADERLRPSDRGRLVGSAGPDSALADKERFEHLRGAFDELSDVHTRILVMRELEGLSYREIAEKLDLSRASVESALFRARRRLESEYADISEGRRCTAMRSVMARIAEGLRDRRDEARLARHARRCHHCRRRARELGVEPLAPAANLRRKAAALLPLPLFIRRGGHAAPGGAASGGQGPEGLPSLFGAGAQVGSAVAERAVAIVAAAALAGAGGMALSGGGTFGDGRDGAKRPAVEQPAPAPGAGKTGGVPGDAGEAGAARAQDGPGARSPRPGPGNGGEAAAAQQHEAPAASSEAPAGGYVGPPGLPGVPGMHGVPGVSGGSSGGRSDGDPQLPVAPSPPSLQTPSAPSFELQQAQPRLGVPQSLPVEASVLSDLPAVETVAPLDKVTETAAG